MTERENDIVKGAIDHGKPYEALPSGGQNSWWYIADSVGYNCIAFASKPGAKFTNEATAVAVAAGWNLET